MTKEDLVAVIQHYETTNAHEYIVEPSLALQRKYCWSDDQLMDVVEFANRVRVKTAEVVFRVVAESGAIDFDKFDG